MAPDGEVVWEGHPASLSDATVEKQLRKAREFWLRDVCTAVKPAAAAFRKGKLAEAEKLATAVSGDGGREAAADAQYVLDRVRRMRDFWNGRVETGTARGLYADVFEYLDRIAKHFAGTEAAKAAEQRKARLRADPAVKRELSAAKKLRRLFAEKAEIGRSARKRDALAKKIEKFIRKYEGTKTATRAGHLLEAVRKLRVR